MELWAEAIAFVQEPGPDDLYLLLRPIGYSRVEIERLEDRARYFAQRFPCDPKRGIAPVALTELTEVLNELLGLIEEETRLSSLPPPKLEPPKPGASLLDQTTSDHLKWLDKPHDYALPEKDPHFSRRKRRAVERLFHLHEKASAEVLTTVTAMRLGKETWFTTQDAKTEADPAITRPRDATASPEDADHSVKIRVLEADGKYRGSLFRDESWHQQRWPGAPKPNLQESMVCKGDPGSGQWFLIEYVLPRKVVGQPENDSLFDESSYCCRRTPAQALHWFQGQAFGPPAALVDHVRRLAKLWSAFRTSPSAQSMLTRVAEGKFVASDDTIFAGSGAPDFLLLRDAELISPASSGGSTSYFATDLVTEMGIEGFIAWTNQHLDQVSTWLESSDTTASPSSTPDSHASEEGQTSLSLDRPSPAHPAADARQLVGWKEILPVLGRDPKSRSDREMVSKLNDLTNGPIKKMGQRSVIANHGVLLLWFKTASDQADAKANLRTKSDRNDLVIDSTLNNPGVRRDEGFHVKERPNKRKRDRG